jgi:hypothetical protein
MKENKNLAILFFIIATLIPVCYSGNFKIDLQNYKIINSLGVSK